MPALLVVARHYWPAPGAASVRLGSLVGAARARGWTVDVITGTPGPDVDSAGVPIHRVSGDTSTGLSGRRLAELWGFSRATVQVGRSLGPVDVVIADPPPTAGLSGLRVAREHNALGVYYYADSWADMVGQSTGTLARAVSPAVRAAESRALRRADVVVAVTERLQTQASAARGGADDVLLVPNGADLSDFSADGEQWADPWGGSLPYVVYAGNMGVVHGAPVFLDAAERLWTEGAEFGVAFLGYGVDRAAIQARAAGSDGRCVVIDGQPPAVAASAFRGAVAGLASVRPIAVTLDSRPAKAVASIACGCPVLYAGSGVFADTVQRERLGLAVPHDADATTVALRTMLTAAPGTWDRSAIAAYARTHFDHGRAMDGLLDLITTRLAARRTFNGPAPFRP